MVFLDVAFLPSRAISFTTFLKNCGRGESLGTTTCPKTVARGNQRHATCNICLLQQGLCFVSVDFCGDHKTVTKIR